MLINARLANAIVAPLSPKKPIASNSLTARRLSEQSRLERVLPDFASYASRTRWVKLLKSEMAKSNTVIGARVVIAENLAPSSPWAPATFVAFLAVVPHR